MMSTATRNVSPIVTNQWVPWIACAVGLLFMYVPTYLSLARGVWQSEEQGHGPLIVAVSCWLIWRARSDLVSHEIKGGWWFGGLSIFFGLVFYVLGRSQDVLALEVGSQIFVIAGLLMLVGGKGAMKSLWFPVVFLIFMVPLPGAIVDGMTGPLKRHVSEIAEHLLYAVGYPIARSGVTLTIGPYQLLVADACSGLHSLYSLSALGLLYLYLMKHVSKLRNAILATLIVPIAFGANVIRVIFLVLVTYHLGDEAGQGFLHGFAGMVLFVAALSAIFAVDSVLGILLPTARKLHDDV